MYHRINASVLQLYLKGITFPATKQDILTTAKANGAPDNILDFINRLPEIEYGGRNMVEGELGRIR